MCPQVSGLIITKSIPFTNCFCCGGHLKYQYENALGVKLEIKVKLSAIKNKGREPCVFILSVIK